MLPATATSLSLASLIGELRWHQIQRQIGRVHVVLMIATIIARHQILTGRQLNFFVVRVFGAQELLVLMLWMFRLFVISELGFLFVMLRSYRYRKCWWSSTQSDQQILAVHYIAHFRFDTRFQIVVRLCIADVVRLLRSYGHGLKRICDMEHLYIRFVYLSN